MQLNKKQYAVLLIKTVILHEEKRKILHKEKYQIDFPLYMDRIRAAGPEVEKTSPEAW